MTLNTTNVTVLNQVDLSTLEQSIDVLNTNIAITNNLIIYIIFGVLLLLFFRNVGRVYKRGKK